MYSLQLQKTEQQPNQVTNAQDIQAFLPTLACSCMDAPFMALMLPPALSAQVSEAVSTARWTAESFGCSNCAKLLYNPVVLNCGHAVCQATCRPWADGSAERACPRCEASIVGSPSICTQVEHG